MFKRKLKIKSICATSSGEYLFTFGLGRDGRCYVWNTIQEAWLPHVQVVQSPPKTEAE